jgi:prevent-host-death family protein
LFLEVLMKRAAVSELKARLSEFLTSVKAGEEIVITDRGRPVARITPITRDRNAVTERLSMLERAGLAAIGTGKVPAKFWTAGRVKDKKGDALRFLLQEREEDTR